MSDHVRTVIYVQMYKSHFKQTEERKLEVRSIVSSQISEIPAAPNMLATGND